MRSVTIFAVLLVTGAAVVAVVQSDVVAAKRAPTNAVWVSDCTRLELLNARLAHKASNPGSKLTADEREDLKEVEEGACRPPPYEPGRCKVVRFGEFAVRFICW